VRNTWRRSPEAVGDRHYGIICPGLTIRTDESKGKILLRVVLIAGQINDIHCWRIPPPLLSSIRKGNTDRSKTYNDIPVENSSFRFRVNSSQSVSLVMNIGARCSLIQTGFQSLDIMEFLQSENI
jgi:hypothetical protein